MVKTSGTTTGSLMNCTPPELLAPSRMPRSVPLNAAAAAHSRPPCMQSVNALHVIL